MAKSRAEMMELVGKLLAEYVLPEFPVFGAAAPAALLEVTLLAVARSDPARKSLVGPRDMRRFGLGRGRSSRRRHERLRHHGDRHDRFWRGRAPVIDAENLFRRPGPGQGSGQTMTAGRSDCGRLLCPTCR